MKCLSEEEEDPGRINIKIDAKIHKKIKQLSFDSGLFIYEVIEIACEEYITRVNRDKSKKAKVTKK